MILWYNSSYENKKNSTFIINLLFVSYPSFISSTKKDNHETKLNIKISKNSKQEKESGLVQTEAEKRNIKNSKSEAVNENSSTINKNTSIIENNLKSENGIKTTNKNNTDNDKDIKNNNLIKNDNEPKFQADTSKIIPSLRNKVTETLWVNGVNINVENFRKQNDPSLKIYEYSLKNSKNEGWYDINKRLENGDWSLCSAVVATNWLHWWLDRNQEYVNRYIKEFPDKAVIKVGDITKKLKDIKVNFPDENNYYDRSRIFDYFVELFPNKTLFPNKLIDMFINGYKYISDNYYFNNENNYNPADSRGFFKDVFKYHTLTSFVRSGSKEALSMNIRSWIKQGRALAISFGSGNKGHIVTIWGADFDNDGNVLAVYISDSDNKDDKMRVSKDGEYERVGMTRLRIDYSSGNAKLSGHTEEGKGVDIWHIYSIQDGNSYWKDFFKKVN
ncbi:IdeS/Mac family cysteine endopeptidase [Mycoplasma zalophidermidis]|uniref:IdeS/Mac family cysteine endopeptidase n=1 Tax=Mycoplasma zalophidermidis TaxID=398174 RepID=UPI00359024E6